MKSRYSFKAFLSALCLFCIVSVSAQTSLIDARARAIYNTFKSYSTYTTEGMNARHGSQAAAARLKANNGNDQAMIDYIATYYNSLDANDAAYWVNLPSMAWVLCNYWDKFTPAQRENLKNRVKQIANLVNSGTENHTITMQIGGYLLAQRFPNESGWYGGRTSSQLMTETRTNLMNIMKSLYSKGYNEDLSTTYLTVHLSAYFALYDCATDPEVKNAADAALNFHIAHLAANHFNGLVIPPFTRENASQANRTDGSDWNPSANWINWLYWGESGVKTPDLNALMTNTENRYICQAAISGWRPSAAIISLALGQAVPYELRSTKCNFEHYGAGGAGEYERYVYRDKLYAMGSGNMRFRPNGYHLDYKMSGLVYKSNDNYNYIDWKHFYWRSNDRIWRGASPFVQTAQYKSTAIVLFNIPTADPWPTYGEYLKYRNNHFNALIQEGLVRYPKSIDEKVEANGWIFLREGDVYIAIRPLKDYTIVTNYNSLMTKGSDATNNNFIDVAASFNVIRSAFGQTGFVIDVAVKGDFVSFADFQTAVSAKTVNVNWTNFTVNYTSLKGNVLAASWQKPSPDYPNVPLSYGNNVNAQVWVRPNFTIDGASVGPDSDFTGGNAVIKSSVISLVNRKLTINIPGGESSVDWSGANPVFINTNTTSVRNVTKSDVSIYPTITTDMIYFNDFPKDSIVELVDIFGRTLEMKSASDLSAGLSLKRLNHGLYIARIIQDDSLVQSLKIIKK
jgi:hypothetical protein